MVLATICEVRQQTAVIELPDCFAAVRVLGDHCPVAGEQLKGQFYEHGVMTIENVTQKQTFVGVLSSASRSKGTVRRLIGRG